MSSHSLHHAWPATSLLRQRKRATAPITPTVGADERQLLRVPRHGLLTAIVTDVALHSRLAGGAWRRIAWIDTIAITRAEVPRTIRVHHWSDADRRQMIDVTAGATAIALIADRITHAHLYSRRLEIAPGVIAIVEAVRVGDDEPVWRVHVVSRAGGDSSVIEQASRAAVGELRSLTGI